MYMVFNFVRADLKWSNTMSVIEKQQGRTLSDEEINNLSWEERCDFVRSNPATAARHFDNKVQLFLRYNLLNKQLITLGKITDYRYRIEFQQRVSPHVHILALVDYAPWIQKNTLHVQEVQQFVENYITCDWSSQPLHVFSTQKSEEGGNCTPLSK